MPPRRGGPRNRERAKELMPGWRHPDVEVEWLACDEGIDESLRRATKLREEAPEGLAVKASGGISSLGDALDILNAGASRLGMSRSVAVMKEAEDGGLQE